MAYGGALGRGRRFGIRERSVLFLASGGRCSVCGRDLGPSWHADHVIPWARGGETDVINGRALCPTCNLKKGVRMYREWPSSRQLRMWQQRAWNKILDHRRKDFLLVATPAAGKTTLALWVMSEFLRTGRSTRFVVVVPTEHLKTQWADAAHKVGLDIDPKWSNGRVSMSADFCGVVVTYAQVASNPDAVRFLCGPSTLVILDEIHHASESRSWGEALEDAFDQAGFRLSMSGTPFRTDNNPISFVLYDPETGLSQPDFSYTYSEALEDEICRPVLFPSYEGNMTWYSRGYKFSASFAEDLSDAKGSHRLRTALDPDGQWLPQVLRDADAKLTHCRMTHRDAGGLIVALGTRQAEGIAKILAAITGETPIIVTFEDPAASDKIAEFARSSGRWIIAIRMISEGVDIPRLRVGVYATNILTEMFFRQVVGRFLRAMKGLEDQNAYIYIPKEAALIDFAMKIMEERNHQLEEEIEAIREAERRGPEVGEGDDKVASVFVPISSTGRPDDIVFNRAPFSQSEKEYAESVMREAGVPSWYDPIVIAMILRKSGHVVPPDPAPSSAPTPGPSSEPTFVRVKALKKIVNLLVARIVEASDDDCDYKYVYTKLINRDGVSMEEAEIVHLESRIRFLDSWLKEIADGR